MNNPESIEQTPQAPKRNPYTPWFVVLAFGAPVVAAYVLYFLGVTPPAFSNKGELLSPIIDIESFALTDDNGQPMQRDEITVHKWHMILFTDASCDEACNQALYNMRQINIAVGKNANRLRRLIVHLDKPGIVRMGRELDAPFHLVWSCYENGPAHCFKCESCLRLKRALRLEGLWDEIARKL